MRISAAKLSLLSLATLAGVAACGGGDDVFVPPPPPTVVGSTGTVVVDWTINGAKDPAACTQLAASALQVSFATTGGLAAGTYEQPCSSFAASVALSPGSYVANAQFVDVGGAARTTVVAIQPFTIYGNDQLVIPIDFPFNSFY